MSSLIMHVDMDAFFAAIEQQLNPSLRGKPIIIGGRNNKHHSVICAASYEAKARGVQNAMPSWMALKICPEAIFVPADTEKYVYTSNEIHDILKTFSPQVQKFSVDEFFLDISGCDTFFGLPEKMGRQVKKAIKDRFGITASIGVAPTKIAAKVAGKMRKPDGLYVMDKQKALQVLARLPVQKICGIGNRLQRRFNRLGIMTCGDLAGFPDHVLKQQFGVVGLWLKAACRVEDTYSSAIDYFDQPPVPPKSVGHSQTLRQQSTDQRFIKEWIYLLSEMVGARMRKKGLQGRTVYFYVSDGFGGGTSRQKTYFEPTYDGKVIYQRCLDIISSLSLPQWCARVLHVSMTGLEPVRGPDLFEEVNRRDRLMHSLDQINHKHGDWTIHPASVRRAVY